MATHNTLHVEVVTAEREIYNGEADMVVARGTEGVLGILPRHAALLTTLAIGEMRIKLGDAEEPLFVAGGFLEVRDNVVTVLADTAEHAEEIDEARAEDAGRPRTSNQPHQGRGAGSPSWWASHRDAALRAINGTSQEPAGRSQGDANQGAAGRYSIVMLSEAKHLAAWRARPFASPSLLSGLRLTQGDTLWQLQ